MNILSSVQTKSCAVLLILCLFLVATLAVACENLSVPYGSLEPDTDIQLQQVKQSTPEDAAISLEEALNRNDFETMDALLYPSDESNQVFLRGYEMMLNDGVTVTNDDVSVAIVEQTESMARLRTYFYQTIYKNGEVLSEGRNGSWYTLTEKDGKWYFIGLADPVPPGWIIER